MILRYNVRLCSFTVVIDASSSRLAMPGTRMRQSEAADKAERA